MFVKYRPLVWHIAIIPALCMTLGGCGGADDRPVVEYVSGTVLFDGKPLTDATVVFAPANGQHTAEGKTDEQGRFELSTFSEGDGAIVGQHRVTVVAREASSAGDQIGGGMPGGPSAPAIPKALIPEKYLDASTSGLEADVKQGEDNDFTFELTP